MSEKLSKSRRSVRAGRARDLAHRSTLRISEVEDIIGAEGIIQPTPSRQNLIDLIRQGVLKGRKIKGQYCVRKDSFIAWVKDLSGIT